MTDYPQTIGHTSRTLLDALCGPDCDERRQRVAELVRIYQPVWERVAKSVLLKYGAYENATIDAKDVAGDEILKMLDPNNDYFGTKASKGSLRAWLKKRIRNRVIDLLRKRSTRKEFAESSALAEAKKHVDSVVDEQEMYELFRVAMQIAERICSERGQGQDYEVFRAVKGGQGKPPKVSEWYQRMAISRTWDIVRDEAIPAAAASVCEDCNEATAVAQELWDRMRCRRNVDLPS